MIYIERLLENLWDVEYNDSNVESLYKISDFIETELNKIDNPLIDNIKRSIKNCDRNSL